MNYTQQIIQDAIEGGWKDSMPTFNLTGDVWRNNKKLEGKERDYFISEQRIKLFLSTAFLDPLFWQAVGKTRGWVQKRECLGQDLKADWFHNWHEFIDHLAEGDNYETALSKLV